LSILYGDGLSNLFKWQNGLNPDTDDSQDSWTDYEYDGSGHITKELRKEVRLVSGTWTICSLSEKRMDYDKLGRMRWQMLLATVGSPSATNDTVSVSLYDLDGAVTKTFNKGIAVSFDPNQYQYSTIDAQNRDIVTEYHYDAVGRLTSQIFDPNQGGMQLTTTYAYDAAGRQTTVTLPGSRTSTSYYDVLDRITKATDAEGAITETSYNSRNRTIKSLLYTVAGASTTYFTQQRIYYNVFGDLTRQATLSNPGVTTAYSLFNPSTTDDRVIDYSSDYTSASRYRYTYTYNSGNAVTAISQTSSDDNSGRGLPTIVTQGQAISQPKVTQKRFYDKAGRVTQEIRENYEDASNILRVTTQMAYDSFGRATSSIAVGASNLTTTYTYDGDDRPIKVGLPRGYETSSVYDVLGRMTSKVEDSGTGGIARTTNYIFDRLGRQVTLIANDGTSNQTTLYVYDKASHVVTTTYPDNLSIRYAYGNTGQVTQRIDQRGVTTNYNYDNLGRLVTKYKQNDTIKEVYAYDARGLITLAKKGDGVPYSGISADTLTYDGFGAVITSSQSVMGTSKTITYARNPLGQASEVRYPDSSSTTMKYAYTSLGQIDTVKKTGNPDTTLVDYNYYGSVVHTRTYNQANVTLTASYDTFGRISTYNTLNNATPAVGVQFAYAYDNNSNILTQTFNHHSSTTANIYSYDRLDRLTRSDYHHNNENEQFTYDTLGNRLTAKPRTGSNIVYLHDRANEITKIDSTQVYYDAAGNLTKDHRVYTYYYDQDNRLTQVRDSAGTATKATYAYDAIGRRVRSIIGTTTTQYYYDGQRVLLETNAGGATDQRYYVWGNYIDEALMMRKLTVTAADYYYGHDHLYTPVVLFNSSGGTIAERYEYDAYGKMYRQNADFTDFSGTEAGNPYYFTGRELDSIDSNALKIMYYRARSYDPTTGRFLQRDPIGCVDGFNLYEYVSGKAINFVDPYGLKKKDIVDIGKLVEKYCLSEAGRRELHDRITKLRLPWSEIEAEAAEIADLGGKYILPCSICILGILDSTASDACAAEIPPSRMKDLDETNTATCMCYQIQVVNKYVVVQIPRSIFFPLLGNKKIWHFYEQSDGDFIGSADYGNINACECAKKQRELNDNSEITPRLPQPGNVGDVISIGAGSRWECFAAQMLAGEVGFDVPAYSSVGQCSSGTCNR
jgi:RHS repeat-associated protein